MVSSNRGTRLARDPRFAVVAILLSAGVVAACSHNGAPATPAAPATVSAAQARIEFPPAEKFGGFDARRAFAHMETTVGYGPRPVGSEGSRKSQEYIKAQLAASGCAVEEDNFEASTPIGRQKMKNILGKAAGEKQEIILLLSHYDTKLDSAVPNFVGANDPGASLGSVLELARLLCAPGRKRNVNYWFGFTDGEEAFGEWSDINGTFGSRQMAAKFAASGDLKKIKAVVLLDLMGHFDLAIRREEYSTDWLQDLIWATAKRLGYEKEFPNVPAAGVEDDHLPFLRRKVSAVDLIDINYPH